MRVIAAIVFLFFCAAGAINAEALTRVVSETSDATALTIYPDNLALITETRTIDLPKGQSTIVFSGVSDRMIPASVLLRAFSGFTLERNFDYARLDKANLFAKSVGQYVTVTRTNRKSGKVSRDRAKIISAKQGVVLEIDGRYEAFQCSGLAEGTRFDKIPDGLRGVPELSIDVETQTAGPQTLVISYLADHFSWEADYRMDITEQGQRAKLLGWLTIENETSKTFKNAPLAIVAGELNRGYKTRAPDFTPTYLFANCWPRGSSKTGVRGPIPMISRQTSDKIGYMPPAPVAQAYGEADEIVVTGSKKREVKQEDLGDYKLYRINEPVNVAAHQTKQIRFIQAKKAEYTKIYNFDIWLDGSGDDDISVQPSRIEYRLDNDKDGEIAKALPKGTMRVFTTDGSGYRRVVGETDVKNTPVGQPMKIYLDESTLVQVASRVVERSVRFSSRLDAKKITLDMEHVISNASDVEISIEMRIPGVYKSLKINHLSDKRDPSVEPWGWTIKVPPGQSHILSYRAQYIYY